MRRSSLLAASACVLLTGAAHAQRLEHARSAAVATPDSAAVMSVVPSRIIVGALVGTLGFVAGSAIGTGLPCFTGNTASECEYHFLLVGIAGYAVGSALGAAARRSSADGCPYRRRVLGALPGAVIGTGLSMLVISGDRSVKGAEAVAFAAAILFLPPVGATISLGRCR